MNYRNTEDNTLFYIGFSELVQCKKMLASRAYLRLSNGVQVMYNHALFGPLNINTFEEHP